MSATAEVTQVQEATPTSGVRSRMKLSFNLVAAVGVLVAIALATSAASTYVVATYMNQSIILVASALGLMIVVGWAKEVSIMQAGLTGTACYFCGSFWREADGMGMPFLIAAFMAIALVVAISVAVSLATAKLSGIYIMILTLAVQVTMERTFFTSGMVQPGINGVAQANPRPEIFGLSFRGDKALFLLEVGMMAVLILFIYRLRASRFGRSLILAGTDRQAASSVGVSPWRAKIFAFALAGMCAGVAGVLLTPLFTTPPNFISFVSLQSLFYLAIPVLAGFRSIAGIAIIGILFSIGPQALEDASIRISPFFLGGVGLILGTMAGAQGVSGVILRQRDALRTRRADAAGAGLVPDAAARDAAYNSALEVLERYLPPRVGEGDVLVVDGVSISFGGLRALSDVSLTVPAKGLVGLIGPNGAGKSTLFDIINGLRPPDEGRIHMFGQDVSDTRAWDRAALGLSRTFQSSRVNLELSVRDNLMSGAYKMIPGNLVASVLGLPGPKAGERRAEEAGRAIAHLLGLSSHWDATVSDLDFGAQRRVEIGRSLMSGPKLLILDEPAAGLDATEAFALFALIRRLKEDLGLTVLLVEHFVKAVLDNCETVYVLSQGQIIARGTPTEVENDPQVRAVYLGQSFVREGAQSGA